MSEKPKITEIEYSEALNQNRVLSAEKKELEAEVELLKKQLKAINDVLEAQVHNRLVGEVLAKTKLNEENVRNMSVEELETIVKVSRVARVPESKSIQFAGETKDEDGFTVGDLLHPSFRRGDK